MKLCKQAAQTDCGQKICCFECDQKATCELACQFASNEGCENLYEEETAMQAFNDKAMTIMKNIAALDKQKKALEEQDKEVRDALKKVMDEYGIKSFENDILKVTFVAETTRTSIDSTKLKKDHPDIVAKYSKTSKVSASVRISVKE